MEKKLHNRQDAAITNTYISKYKYTKNFDKELDFCKKLEYQKYDEKRVQSSYDRALLFSKEMKNLKDFIQECINNYCNEVLKGGQLFITESWVGRQEKGQSVEPHKHRSLINGCFYFTVPDDSTPLVFNRANQLNLIDDFRVPVSTGDLILFPNKLEHWVPENKSDKTRYVIGFNSNVKQAIEEWTAIANFYSEGLK